MKKIIILFMLTLTILGACNTSTLSISEIAVVPDEVQKKIISDDKLQLINDGKDTFYIVFYSKGIAHADLEVQGDILKIKFEETNPSNEVAEQYVYKITKDPEQEIIEVYINGKFTHFDYVITGL
ncbi:MULTISPECIES: peptidylprolyl isomerase [Lysinibacillus]|uniref:Peptidylprolyl isomerase n=1 Tax=Lysinibacillus xylanilyticus TaxID=582475 RepID=A0ABV3VR47_9BACI